MNLTTRTELDRQTAEAVGQLRAGRTHLAIKMLWRVLRQQPDHVAARLRLAEAMIRDDQCEQALGHLDAADLHRRMTAPGRSDRLTVRARLLRGRALQRLGRTADAIDAWRQALADQPDCISALRGLAAACYHAEQYDQALRAAERLIALRPTDTPALRLIVDAGEAVGRNDRAIEALDELARRRGAVRDSPPRYTKAECLRLARLLRKAGRTADAVERYRALAKQIQGDATLASEWADLAAEIGDEAAANGALHAALHTRPCDARAMTQLAQQHMRTGRFPEAGRTWWRLHRILPTATPPLAGLLVCAIQAMRPRLIERVEARLERTGSAAERLIAMADAWAVATPGEVLGDLLDRRAAAADNSVLEGLLSEAVTTFENALPDHREFADVHYHLAVCHEALGEPTGAAECLDRSLKINPGYIDAACRRAEQLLADGHPAAADAVIAGALDRHPHDDRLTALQQRTAAALDRYSSPIADAA